ncbi:MAG: cation diffusion facilitator family transporter [Negativicutes bacterium]|nr:cation diffusion facilitator family transporter [Negativicutes bacterium]
MLEAQAKLKQRAAALSVLASSMLVIAKLAVGALTGSVSIISEAAHSGVDLMAAIIAWVAVRRSAKPPDQSHAYGHGKIENISGAVEALLIIGAALWIIYEAVEKLLRGGELQHLDYGIAVMCLSVAVNYFVSRRLIQVATLTGSHALEADALHLRTDMWTSLGVIGGLAAVKLTGLVWLDPAIAIAVSFLIFKAGFEMTRKSVYELMDVSLPPEEEDLIIEIILSHPAVINCHDLRTRRSGSLRMIDVHLILHKDMHLDKAHAICDAIEKSLCERLGHCDVVIHLEPCGYHEEFGQCPY